MILVDWYGSSWRTVLRAYSAVVILLCVILLWPLMYIHENHKNFSENMYLFYDDDLKETATAKDLGINNDAYNDEDKNGDNIENVKNYVDDSSHATSAVKDRSEMIKLKRLEDKISQSKLPDAKPATLLTLASLAKQSTANRISPISDDIIEKYCESDSVPKNDGKENDSVRNSKISNVFDDSNSKLSGNEKSDCDEQVKDRNEENDLTTKSTSLEEDDRYHCPQSGNNEHVHESDIKKYQLDNDIPINKSPIDGKDTNVNENEQDPDSNTDHGLNRSTNDETSYENVEFNIVYLKNFKSWLAGIFCMFLVLGIPKMQFVSTYSFATYSLVF